MLRKDINNEVMTYMHKFEQTANRHVESRYEMDEVIAITIEFFLNTNDDKIVAIYNNDGIEGCIKYVCRTIITQATSTRSRYYYKTRRENIERRVDLKSYIDDSGTLVKPLENLSVEIDVSSTAELLTELDVILDNDIHYYLSKLFRMNKLEGMSMTEIARKTQIGRNEVFNAITKATKQIKLAAYIRKMREDKTNDFGVISQDDYNTKYKISSIPVDYIPRQLILDLLEDNENDFTTVAHELNVPYGRLKKYITKYNIKL
jgi:predicted DNA-binding protein YlxM (UPF0122 family)